jgi:hypothetical protein
MPWTGNIGHSTKFFFTSHVTEIFVLKILHKSVFVFRVATHDTLNYYIARDRDWGCAPQPVISWVKSLSILLEEEEDWLVSVLSGMSYKIGSVVVTGFLFIHILFNDLFVSHYIAFNHRMIVNNIGNAYSGVHQHSKGILHATSLSLFLHYCDPFSLLHPMSFLHWHCRVFGQSCTNVSPIYCCTAVSSISDLRSLLLQCDLKPHCCTTVGFTGSHCCPAVSWITWTDRQKWPAHKVIVAHARAWRTQPKRNLISPNLSQPRGVLRRNRGTASHKVYPSVMGLRRTR